MVSKESSKAQCIWCKTDGLLCIWTEENAIPRKPLSHNDPLRFARIIKHTVAIFPARTTPNSSLANLKSCQEFVDITVPTVLCSGLWGSHSLTNLLTYSSGVLSRSHQITFLHQNVHTLVGSKA